MSYILKYLAIYHIFKTYHVSFGLRNLLNKCDNFVIVLRLTNRNNHSIDHLTVKTIKDISKRDIYLFLFCCYDKTQWTIQFTAGRICFGFSSRLVKVHHDREPQQQAVASGRKLRAKIYNGKLHGEGMTWLLGKSINNLNPTTNVYTL